MKAFLLALTTVAFTSVLLSCSAHEFANPQRKSNADCIKAGGTPIGDKFCLAGMDAGPRMMTDAGPDANMMSVDSGTDAMIDAGPPEPCGKEGDTRSCYSGDEGTSLQLPCKPGMQTCHAGVWSDCVGEVTPEPETCNDGKDDDCDGKSDEGTSTGAECAVENQQGACGIGALICKAGTPICAQITFPMTEVCNGEDDDCNGMTDDSTDQPCYSPNDGGCMPKPGGGYTCVGSCKQGVQKCDDGQYGTCEGSVGKQADEVCTVNGAAEEDENCNGTYDENCSCHNGDSCYTGPQGTLGHSPCKAGTKACTDATHGTCMSEVVPVAEDCSNEGKDDDCNGSMDDWAPRGTSCSSVSTAKGACKAGATWQCMAKVAACVPAAPGDETCDGKIDEDCDGKVDEDFLLDSDPNNCGSCGHKCTVSQTCCAGSCVDTRSSNANCSTCGKSCTSGQTCCNSGCINPTKDKNNCGSCGNICSGLTACANGACVLLGL